MSTQGVNKAYTVAILADIHGNKLALQAVMEDLAGQRYDELILVGDLALNGPDPAGVLELIQELGLRSVRGNTDEMVVNRDGPVSSWVAEQIGKEGLDFLGSLPLEWRCTPPGGKTPFDDLLVVHSTPRSPHDLLVLEPHPMGSDILVVTESSVAAQMLAGSRSNLILYGHIHYFSSGTIAGQRLVTVGSVGFPFDGDRRAAYGLANWDGSNWRLEAHRVAYDHAGVVRQLEQSTLPNASRSAEMIRRARWLSMDPT